MKQEPLGNFHPNQLKGIYSDRDRQATQGVIKLVGAVVIAVAAFVALYMIKSSLGINLFDGSPVGEFLDGSGICEHFGICHDISFKGSSIWKY